MFFPSLTLVFVATVLASPLAERAIGPTVKIKNGTVVGSSLGNIDSFKGIPFAQPPVGELRLKPPQPVKSSFGTITATGVPTSCPQFATQADTSNVPQDALAVLLDSPLLQTVSSAGEDCLTLNVQRPSGTTKSSALPVVYWIYGGGFETGSTQMYDATNFITKSVSLGEPVLYVAVNYRVGGFGFLAGKDLASEGSTNLGLRDQRLGLQWVQDNIAAFGGDPTKVTIWGESAGSISVYDQTIINGGDNTYKGKAMFRGAIMNSGSVVPADPVTAPQAQAIYDTVVDNAGCSGSSNTLECLRSKDYTTFLNAANSVPGIFSYRSLDLSYLPRPDPGDNFFSHSPELALNSGKFAKVPNIIGDEEDEGTLFSLVLSNISTNAEVINYLTSYFPNDANAKQTITGLVANYPDQPLAGQPAGSPFGTGALNNIYPQYKRLAAILGDVTFTLARRNYLNKVSGHVKSWSYLNSYFFGLPVLGTAHGLDILLDYGTGTQLLGITQTTQTYYINFINNLDPNGAGAGSGGVINWPQYTTASPSLVNFQKASNVIIQDTFRLKASKYLATKGQGLRV